jgi:succinate dehydrogenase/fumarate reductase cytochrome b subunit
MTPSIIHRFAVLVVPQFACTTTMQLLSLVLLQFFVPSPSGEDKAYTHLLSLFPSFLGSLLPILFIPFALMAMSCTRAFDPR